MKYPVLAYHKVSPQWELSFTMLFPSQFEKQIRFLAEKGYRGRSLRQYLVEPREKDFVLTFDDAYESVYQYAMPILKELGFRATVFVPTNYIGKTNTWDFTPGNILSRHMSADQIKELHREGWEIASHGEGHHVLTTLDLPEIKNELLRSKEILEGLIDDRVDSFCFPFGVYNSELVKAAEDAGYDHLVGFTGTSRYKVISRSPVYRVVDGPRSVLRKIRLRPPSLYIEYIKETIFHAFSLLTRIKQRISKK